mmetsp:Transcript_82523/g.160935  ORF Transcript_82523/g.160935 Transcript_82523/m.160935 type:complete len:135 (-) Transcript_82523:98-502(-)
MDQDDAADTFAAGAVLPPPPAKGLSPPRRPGARGKKSARASRPSDDDVRNSDEKPARRVASTRNLPRAAATNHTAMDMLRAGGDYTAAATAAQRRHAPGGSSEGVSPIANQHTADAAACNNAPPPPHVPCTHPA